MGPISAPVGRRCILLAHCDVRRRNLLANALTREGHFILTAATAREAEDLARAFAGPIDLLLADFPPDNPGDAARRIQQERPGIRVILLTAETQSELLEMWRQTPPAEPAALPPRLRARLNQALADAAFPGEKAAP